MNKVRLIWITPEAEKLLVYIARVSNPKNQTEGRTPARLLRYLIDHKHWSPFEMVSACFEINTTRDIGRQILRHRSFSFQEFSQRYANPTELDPIELREARLQDDQNRQNSIPVADEDLQRTWQHLQGSVYEQAHYVYAWAIQAGVAKEVARTVLPEGLTPTRMYMSGTIRSWIHYLNERCSMATQLEHRLLAMAIRTELQPLLPAVFAAVMLEKTEL